MDKMRFLMAAAITIALGSKGLAQDKAQKEVSDVRYKEIEQILRQNRLHLDQNTTSLGSKVWGIRVLQGESDVGIFSMKDDVFYLAVTLNNESIVYSFRLVDGTVVTTKELPELEKEEGESSNNSKSWALGACQYVARLQFYYACISDDNPVGQLRKTETWVGDPISWNHYTWRVDYLGRVRVCPLNSFYPYNPLVNYQCGL